MSNLKMPVLCVSAARLELAWLLGRLKRPGRVMIRGMKVWTGILEEIPVVLACCGIGPERARESMGRLFDRFEAGRVLHFGVCGGLSDRFPLGRAVAAFSVSSAWEPELEPMELFRAGEGPFKRLPPGDSPAEGRFVSNALPVFTPRLKAFLRERFQADCVDMESWEIVRCCRERGVPVDVVKAVSDPADSETGEVFRRHAKTAALSAQNTILELLRSLSSGGRDSSRQA